ncbi:MAG: ROK family protein [Pirellulales bacterium]
MPGRHPARCVTFDVGGTSVRAARYDPLQRTVTQVVHRATPSHRALPDCSIEELREQLFAALDDVTRELLGAEMPDLVGFAFPGPIDPQGNVLSVPTVFGSRAEAPRPIGRELAARWPGVEIVLMNDVTAAGYYYLQRPDESFCITTVSSGVGNKVFVDGRPIVGPGGRGGEIGHIVVDPSPDAPLCDCGGRGHLGGIASGRGALDAVRRAAARDAAGFRGSALVASTGGSADRITNEAIVAAFHAGDAWVIGHISRVTAHLARVLASIHNAIGIERFVIMGGFALALGEGYRKLLADLCSQSTWNLGQDWQQMVELAAGGEHAGLNGAGRAAMQHWEARA